MHGVEFRAHPDRGNVAFCSRATIDQSLLRPGREFVAVAADIATRKPQTLNRKPS